MGMLNGKIALVTGGGSGIGRSVALVYAAEGARVVVADIDEAGGRETQNMITKGGGKAVFMRADCSSLQDNKQLVEFSTKQFGGLDIACNNAGIAGPIAPTGEYPIEGWQKVMDTNLNGVFYGMRFQIEEMLKRNGGAIVNMSSILGIVGTANSPAYVAAKHGVVGLTKAAAIEYADRRIRINAVCPGYILTPLLSNNLTPDRIKAAEALHPMKRIGNVEEVSALVLFLSSPNASFITGAAYPVDGGYLAL
ncbi:MAG: SDR family NAD(P)-dependent oxidoreductase [Sphingobacteriales bacterium]